MQLSDSGQFKFCANCNKEYTDFESRGKRECYKHIFFINSEAEAFDEGSDPKGWSFHYQCCGQSTHACANTNKRNCAECPNGCVRSDHSDINTGVLDKLSLSKTINMEEEGTRQEVVATWVRIEPEYILRKYAKLAKCRDVESYVGKNYIRVSKVEEVIDLMKPQYRRMTIAGITISFNLKRVYSDITRQYGLSDEAIASKYDRMNTKSQDEDSAFSATLRAAGVNESEFYADEETERFDSYYDDIDPTTKSFNDIMNVLNSRKKEEGPVFYPFYIYAIMDNERSTCFYSDANESHKID